MNASSISMVPLSKDLKKSLGAKNCRAGFRILSVVRYANSLSICTAAMYLIVLKEGPSHTIEDVQPQCAVLARRFHGELWTYGGYDADTTVGEMRLRVIGTAGKGKLGAYMQFRRAALRAALRLRERLSSLGPVIVVSYDPFKTGLLAKSIAKLLGGIFVSEVNGAYGDPDTFADVHSKFWKKLRLLQMRLLGTYVLKAADGVKLLFDDQLKGFVTLSNQAIVRRFADIAFVERFVPREGNRTILLAGYPYKRKGTDILFRAFVSIAAEFPDWKLVLIGHQLRDCLERAGYRHPQVVVHPGMPQTELAKWVSNCSIVAQPSRSEAMGRILIEAAAAGKCRVATRVNGIPTVINDGQDGILVAKDSVDELAEVLARLMRDPILRARLGEAAQLRAETEFSYAAYLDSYEDFFQKLIVSKGQKAGQI